MALKYAQQVASLPECPPASCRCVERVAFRFVFVERSGSDNCLPVLMLKPQRALKWEAHRHCSGWALSFFISAETAKTKYQSLKLQGVQVERMIGDGLAVVDIQENDGIQTEPAEDGHFDFHEYDGNSLADRLTLVEPL